MPRRCPPVSPTACRSATRPASRSSRRWAAPPSPGTAHLPWSRPGTRPPPGWGSRPRSTGGTGARARTRATWSAAAASPGCGGCRPGRLRSCAAATPAGPAAAPRAERAAARFLTCRRWPRSAPAARRGYVIYGTAGAFKGQGWQTVGGTSLATPLWAALTALADQRAARHRLGLLSPSLYRIARPGPGAPSPTSWRATTTTSPRYGRHSHDTCRSGRRRRLACYPATRGYDMATGLGSPQAGYLVADLLRERPGRP